MKSRRRAWARLGLICLLFVLFGLVYNVAVPLHKAPDEIAHFMYSRFIAQNERIPATADEREQAGYLSFWPPLYHGAVAVLAGWSHQPPPPHLKFAWESPRVELIETLLDTKRLANTQDEWWPYRGDVLLWHLGRGVSLLFGVGIIIVTFFTALALRPREYRLAVWAAAIIAFIPTFTFISSVMSYESLVGLLAGLYFLVLLRIVGGDRRLRMFIVLGLLLGASVTAKYSTVIVPLEVAVVFIWLAGRNWRLWLKWLAVTGFAALAASGWWFGFIVWHFNEIDQYGLLAGVLKPIVAGGIDASQNYVASVLTGQQMAEIEQTYFTSEPFSAWAGQMFRTVFAMDIQGDAIGLPAFLFVGAFLLLAVVSLGVTWRFRRSERRWVGLLLLHTLFFFVFPLLRFLIQGNITWTAQGRHLLFPVATALPLIFIFGWEAWLSPKVQRRLATALVGGLLIWNVTQVTRVLSAYHNLHTWLPVKTTADALDAMEHRADIAFENGPVLLGYTVQQAGAALNISLFWQTPAYLSEDYRLEINLAPAGPGWTGYPTNARYPTRLWEPWEIIRDDLSLPLINTPAGRYPVTLQLLGAAGPLRAAGSDTVTLTTVAINDAPPPEPDIFPPVSVAGRQVVAGASLWQAGNYRVVDLPQYRPRMVIPLVWRGEPAPDERVQWLLVDENGQVYPAREEGDFRASFVVAPNWPSGSYRLRAEVWQADAVLASQETGPVLTVKNEFPRRLDAPPIASPLAVNFGDRLALLGYDLPVRSLEPGQKLPVTLTWRGLRTMDTSYTIFAKLLDPQGQQVWGSIERYPADGYQTIYWLENEVVIDGFELPVDPATPAGIYRLNVGVYRKVDDQAVSLPLMAEGQPTGETSITFGPVKIGGPPAGAVLGAETVSPQARLNANLGDPPVIRLLGYGQALQGDELSLTLYWESVAPTPVDWSVFVHLRDGTGATVAQMDGPVGGGSYPTSVWAAGEIIGDNFSIPLDTLTGGLYSVVVGLYNIETGERLIVPGNPENALLLDQIEIER